MTIVRGNRYLHTNCNVPTVTLPSAWRSVRERKSAPSVTVRQCNEKCQWSELLFKAIFISEDVQMKTWVFMPLDVLFPSFMINMLIIVFLPDLLIFLSLLIPFSFLKYVSNVWIILQLIYYKHEIKVKKKLSCFHYVLVNLKLQNKLENKIYMILIKTINYNNAYWKKLVHVYLMLGKEPAVSSLGTWMPCLNFPFSSTLLIECEQLSCWSPHFLMQYNWF